MNPRQFSAAGKLLCSAAIYMLLLTGCSQDPEAVALMNVSVDVPTALTDGGTTWTKVDIGEADHACLANFFQKNQQLVGSPDMEGDPVLFTSGKTDRRFYWLSTTIDGSRWVCVHFEKNRYSTSDGTGNPF